MTHPAPSSSHSQPLHQIVLDAGPKGYEPITDQPDDRSYSQEHVEFQANLVRRCPAHLWHKASYMNGCPRPILVAEHHEDHLQQLHEALVAALADIVPRWLGDHEANFPARMPLKKEEEELLQWIDEQVQTGNLPRFPLCMGSWRPDFLVEDMVEEATGRTSETFRITEINARFSFNAFMIGYYGQQVFDEMLKDSDHEDGFVSATDSRSPLDGLCTLFDPSLPLHLLKGAEPGMDIHMFVDAVRRRLGVTPRLIAPEDLRLLADPQSKTGYSLYCAVPAQSSVTPPGTPIESLGSRTLVTSTGETVERIYRVGLELHQHELAALEPLMLRQLSLVCFNDLRTILLVHDKRMLGIIREELSSLVTRQVLSPDQAKVLSRGITETILPGPSSKELAHLVEECALDPELKDQYILKPVRGGKGAGILFGDELTPGEWAAALERLHTRSCSDLLEQGEGVSVIQRRIRPRLYDLVLRANGERVRYPLIGTWFIVRGKFLGFGGWRSSGSKICAVACGGAWICSVRRRYRENAVRRMSSNISVSELLSAEDFGKWMQDIPCIHSAIESYPMFMVAPGSEVDCRGQIHRDFCLFWMSWCATVPLGTRRMENSRVKASHCHGRASRKFECRNTNTMRI